MEEENTDGGLTKWNALRSHRLRHGQRERRRGEAELTAVSTDSRQIPEKALFLPIKGERFDAHDFIAKAIENGAAAVVSHRQNEEYPVPALYVENTSQALLDLAGGYRELCGGKVVGVTGSVGKTTTKELLYAVLYSRSSTRRRPRATSTTRSACR